MPQTTSNLSNSIRSMYAATYVQEAMRARLYDQFAVGQDYYGVEDSARLGSSITIPFLSILPISTGTISQVADINPRQFRDATITVSPTSRGDAIDWAELVDIEAFTNYGESRFKAIGTQQMRSVEWLAIVAALQGSLKNAGNATRSSIDAGTTGHNLKDSVLTEVQTILQSLRCPYMVPAEGMANWTALMHPEVYYDLRTGGNVVNVGVYQEKEIILNFELGKLGPFKLLVSGDAKVFAGAGAANGTATGALTLAASTGTNGSNVALATTIEVSAATNLSSGDWLNIGTVESGNTFDESAERVKYVSASSTTVTVVGSGPNGGLLNDHAVGTGLNNSDSVFPVLYGSPASLVKIYDNKMDSEFGTVVGPKTVGTLDQFGVLGWKFYGQYGITRQNCLLRGEYSSSLEN